MDSQHVIPRQTLLEAAIAARERAHAPYSGFAVGAALRTASGRIFAGCNVENASYPEGICAETAAIAAMVAAGERAITEICIIAESAEPISPCGGCRQRLAEFAGPELPVTMATLDGMTITHKLGELLPLAFRSVRPGFD
ncbi:MAG: cytidine deaminase [Rhodobacteraceae bacterium]|nr:cytidine deaminase [Paracoccaceae bacterium]